MLEHTDNFSSYISSFQAIYAFFIACFIFVCPGDVHSQAWRDNYVDRRVASDYGVEITKEILDKNPDLAGRILRDRQLRPLVRRLARKEMQNMARDPWFYSGYQQPENCPSLPGIEYLKALYSEQQTLSEFFGLRSLHQVICFRCNLKYFIQILCKNFKYFFCQIFSQKQRHIHGNKSRKFILIINLIIFVSLFNNPPTNPLFYVQILTAKLSQMGVDHNHCRRQRDHTQLISQKLATNMMSVA